MKKILVAGGAGLIGTHLCNKLLKNPKNFVYCLDNLYSGQKKNIKNFLKRKNFKFINHNILKKISLNTDEVYNLACPASPKFYQKDPVFTIKTCIIGTANLLDNALKYNAKFLQASTSEVYGNPLIHPQKENYWGNVNPIGVRSYYDEGKRGAETLCFDYHRQYKLPIKVVRIFNTYGLFMNKNDGRVISNFIIQALDDKNITVYGNGNQTRSFCYVSDLIEGLERFMKKGKNICGPINLGNPREITIIDIAKKIIKITNSKSRIVFKKLPNDDPEKRRPNISYAKKIINWSPEVSLDKGLIKTVNYYRGLR